jgi:hypothetical protein
VRGTGTSLALTLVLIGGLVLLALRLPHRPLLLEPGPCRRGLAWMGAAVAPFIFLMAAMASAHLPSAAFVLVSAAFFLGAGWLVHRRGGFTAPAFLRFALGNELAFVALSIGFDGARGALESMAAHVILEMLFILGFVRLRAEQALAAEAEAEPTTPIQNP